MQKHEEHPQAPRTPKPSGGFAFACGPAAFQDEAPGLGSFLGSLKERAPLNFLGILLKKECPLNPLGGRLFPQIVQGFGFFSLFLEL